ncbi:MAG TPA: hypothetical protein VKA21_09130 [Candidatus Binatia bacterium]|nr:hypothetical protein [Candidatus Binatia bacterium]
MARARDGATSGRIRIQEECLQLEVAGSRDIDRLRRWQRRVNEASYAQPYLVEGPTPGRFRLYVGASAERVRTRRGML